MRSLALVLSAFATTALGADAIGRDAVGPRTVRLAYEARLTPPPGTERVELWLPLPREENQAVRELKLTGTGRVTVMRLPESADRVAWVRVEKPHEPVVLGITALVAVGVAARGRYEARAGPPLAPAGQPGSPAQS